MVISGLFRAAISHSGTALAFWAIQNNPREYAIKLATELECPIPETLESSTKDTIDCLKLKSAEELTVAKMKFKVCIVQSVKHIILLKSH